uniref:Secreted protein n=1 Tax=Steinernema glaseri TaxID=37863 RepID=A0A1I7YYA2_9BILA
MVLWSLCTLVSPATTSSHVRPMTNTKSDLRVHTVRPSSLCVPDKAQRIAALSSRHPSGMIITRWTCGIHIR